MLANRDLYLNRLIQKKHNPYHESNLKKSSYQKNEK